MLTPPNLTIRKLGNLWQLRADFGTVFQSHNREECLQYAKEHFCFLTSGLEFHNISDAPGRAHRTRRIKVYP